MRHRRRTLVAVLVSVLVLASFSGAASAGLGQTGGDRVEKEHPGAQARAERHTATSMDLPAARAAASRGNLKMYEATFDLATLQELIDEGYDVTPGKATPDGVEVALVLSPGEHDVLAGKGVGLTPVSAGRERKPRAAASSAQSLYGWQVFRSYDEPGGIEDQIQEVGNAPANRGFARLYDIGDSIEGRDIWAVRLTQGARGRPLGARPAVLYQGTTHAREWISTEVTMRLLKWFVTERRAENPEVVDLLKTRELWFVPVVNPDGYEYTFTTERLWRKNLRDNDGNGVITNADGIDLNRNYPQHWNYDEEGSSSTFSSQTYRGVGPASEPETQANIDLVENMADFRFAISYHSFGNLLLYPQGWQTLTMTADDPIYVALTGTDDNPAVAGFNPGVSADLYTTNGEFTDWAHGEAGVLAWTPELESHGRGFEFPDDEALVQAEFERNLDFALSVAKSALDPDDPASHWGMDTKGLYLNVAEEDPWKTNWQQADLRVLVSHGGGSTQPVEVLAKRAIGAATLHYRINGGPEQTAATSKSPSGDVYGGNNAYNTYYHYLRGEIPVQQGDSIEYWFSAGGETTQHVTFDVVEDADADVLIVAAEDRTGASNSPAYPAGPGPHFVSYYADAITASGRTFDLYDVDAMSRTAPDYLGVLSHYPSVIWYTGNDVVTREAGRGPGNVSRLAVDMTLAMREYLNHGGSLVYTGQRAGFVENGFAGGQFYDPVGNDPCVVNFQLVLNRCRLWGDKNDFIQYYLGGLVYNSRGNPGTATEVSGTDNPYGGTSWFLNGDDGANNQNHHASFITTSSVLPKSEYPRFTSDGRASYITPGGNPFEPFDGDWYVYSQRGDISYKRLMRTINVPAEGGEMTFRFSYDTEAHWDFVFVEAHTVGQDEWTTLPDLNGHTSSDTGDSCPAGWFELHPWLERYQGSDCSGRNPATKGAWHAASGRSQGWEEWRINLTPYAGQQIELSISYANDWAIQGLGSFVDLIDVPGGEGTTSFEAGTDGWTVPGPPPGSDPNPNDWTRTQSLGFQEGAIVSETPTTADFVTLYFGFGFEAIRGAAGRNAVMDATLDFFGV